jgi:hypothetical protein
MFTVAKKMLIGTALLTFMIAISSNSAFAASVFIDLSYESVGGKGDTDLDVTAFFDDSSLTKIGTSVATLSSLDATITSAVAGLNSTFFHLPNTDILCRSFPGVSCFASSPYTATFLNGSFQHLDGVQGLHGTTAGASNYPVNGSILFQLGFANESFGRIAQTRYAIPTQHVHDSLRVSIGEVTAVVPVPAAAWLFGSALGLLGWMRRKVS